MKGQEIFPLDLFLFHLGDPVSLRIIYRSSMRRHLIFSGTSLVDRLIIGEV